MSHCESLDKIDTPSSYFNMVPIRDNTTDDKNESSIERNDCSAPLRNYSPNLNEAPSDEIKMDEDMNIKDNDGIVVRPKTERWSNRIEFILSLVGLTVGFGNIWRFPYYCQKNGGGSFLFPYFLMLFTIGIPLFYFELLLGKKAQAGPLKAMYRLVPMLGGIGVAAIVSIVYVTYYYNLLIAYVLYYLFGSFQSPIAWGCLACGYCSQGNSTINQNFTDIQIACFNDTSLFFYYNSVTKVGSSISDLGSFNWKLFLCIIGSWVLVYICTFKGVKSFGKASYVTALLPYVVLIILFFRAVTLEGAQIGLYALLVPQPARLKDFQVWLEAASQILFSLSLGGGSNILLASHLKQNSNVFWDAIFVGFLNSLTSLFAGIVVFCILGYQANLNGQTNINNIVGGPGLIFIEFARALNEMPISWLWSILFFVMMLSLGLSSQFAAIETLAQCIPDSAKLKKFNSIVKSGMIILLFTVLSIFFSFGNGQYIFQLLDQFAGNYSIYLLALFELIGITWFFGVKKLLADKISIDPATRVRFRKLRENKKFQIFTKIFWTIIWGFLTPFIMITIFIGNLGYQFISPITYTYYRDYAAGTEPYPRWTQFLASVIVISTIIPIPIVFIVKFPFKRVRTFLVINVFTKKYQKYSRLEVYQQGNDPMQ